MFRGLVVVCATAFLGCAGDAREADVFASEPIATRADAIRDGVIDRATDAVVLTTPSERGVCTGVAIASDVVLTAAHCFVTDLAQGCATPYPITRAAPIVAPGTRVIVADKAIDVAEIVGLDSVDVLCGYDIVALRLSEPLGVTPLVPRLDRPPTVGEGVSVIGFGQRDPNDAQSIGLRRRRDDAHVTELGRGTALVMGPGRRTARVGDFVVDVGACVGDSGGPALDRSGYIVGLMSRGLAESCAEVTYTRLDRHASWLRKVVLRAAADRGVDPPSWAVAPLAVPESAEPRAEETAETSCGVARSMGKRDEHLLFALAFAALFGLVWRRHRAWE